MISIASLILIFSFTPPSPTATLPPLEDEARLVFFTSDESPDCAKMAPLVDRMIRDGYPIDRLNVDQYPDIKKRFSILQVPTFVLVQDGREVHREVGNMSLLQLQSIFDQVVSSAEKSQPEIAETSSKPTTSSKPIRFSSARSSRTAESQTKLTKPKEAQQIPSSSKLVNHKLQNDGFPLANTQVPVQQQYPIQQGQIVPNQVVPGQVVPGTIIQGPIIQGPIVQGPIVQGSVVQPAQSYIPSSSIPSSSVPHSTARKSLSARQLAMQATVRLKIEDDGGINHGTGTVIHQHGNEYLVLTCGHIFRDSKGKGTVHAEVGFPNPKTATGILLQYDPDDRDVALISIQTDMKITPVPLHKRSFNPTQKQTFFSVGCDRGNDPTFKTHEFLNLALFSGHKKYFVTNKPIDGRSGGGIFATDGRLVGVCNAATVDDDEGIYSAIDNVYWQIETAGLNEIFEANPRGNESTNPTRVASNDQNFYSQNSADERNSIAPAVDQNRSEKDLDRRSLANQPRPYLTRPSSGIPRPNTRPRIEATPIANRNGKGSGTEMIVVVRQGNTTKSIRVRNPSQSLLDLLEREGESQSKNARPDRTDEKPTRTANRELRLPN